MKTNKFFQWFILGQVLLFAISIFFHTDSAITQDLGRHLTLGKIILTERSIPKTNLFSYTYPSFPFLNHHWGSEVIFYLLDKIFSVDGLIIIKTMIMMFTIGLITLFTIQRARFLPFLIASLLSLEILRERTEIRPEIFAYLIFGLFLVILYKEKEIMNNKIRLLPILQIIWVNLHISFIYGLIIYFLFLIDRILTKKVKREYFIFGGGLLIGTFINPFVLKGAMYPLTIFSSYGYSVVENQSPFFLEKLMDNPTIFYFKLSAVLFLLITPFLLIKRRFLEILSVFFFGGLSILAIRNFPFFALVLIFPLSLGLSYFDPKLSPFRQLIKSNLPRFRMGVYFILSLFLVWEIYSLLSNRYYKKSFSLIRSGLGQVTGLKNMVDYFQKNKLTGPIFNNFDIGSYLVFRLYPNERVFVEGRPEAYPVSFFKEIYIPMQEKEEIWRKVSQEFNFQIIIFSHTDYTPWAREFLKRIAHDSEWQLIYFDDFGVIFVPTNSKRDYLESTSNQEKIKQRGSSLIQKADQPDTLAQLVNFFNLVGFSELERLANIKLKGIRNL